MIKVTSVSPVKCYYFKAAAVENASFGLQCLAGNQYQRFFLGGGGCYILGSVFYGFANCIKRFFAYASKACTVDGVSIGASRLFLCKQDGGFLYGMGTHTHTHFA